MVEHIPYGSARKFVYPSMNWMGRDITEMETKGCARLAHIGKGFLYICRRLIDAYKTIILCEKKKINDSE